MVTFALGVDLDQRIVTTEKTMNNNLMITLVAALTLMGCADEKGQAGDACTTDDDCEDGLECHVEEHDDHEDEEEEDHEEEGVCEEADAHDDH